jgi:hypothetical protein
MATLLFCWRCDMEVPMLTEREWEEVAPLLQSSIGDVKAYRERHGVSLQAAMEVSFGQSAIAKYEEITGIKENNVNVIWHHRASIYGPPCIACGKPLRTPKARLCAACGKIVA